MDRGDLDDAISTLRRSAALGHLESHFNLGLAYERKGRLRDARFEIARAIALDPQPDALNELALIDLQLGDLQQALNILKNLFRDEPQYEPARKNLLTLKSKLRADRETERGQRRDSMVAISR